MIKSSIETKIGCQALLIVRPRSSVRKRFHFFSQDFPFQVQTQDKSLGFLHSWLNLMSKRWIDIDHDSHVRAQSRGSRCFKSCTDLLSSSKVVRIFEELTTGARGPTRYTTVVVWKPIGPFSLKRIYDNGRCSDRVTRAETGPNRGIASAPMLSALGQKPQMPHPLPPFSRGSSDTVLYSMVRPFE